jgi:ubiquinone/menaquinone biosynthesis C-methylase UbiE
MEFPNGIGFDISLQNLERLKVAGKKICCGNLNAQLPFRENAIDTILMSHVLEHVLCPFSLCMEAYRVLRPKGLVIIGVPLEHSFFRLLTMDNYFKHHSGHLYSFSPLGLQKLVETAGFLTKKLLFDIPMARRLESSKLQKIGNQIIPKALLQWICANFWVIGEKPF